MFCPICQGDTEVYVVERAGDVVACTACGTVLKESDIIFDELFGETSVAVVEEEVDAEGHDEYGGPSRKRQKRTSPRGDSQEQRKLEGDATIKTIAQIHGISGSVREMGFRYLKLSLNVPECVVKGRKLQYFAAASLYAACRFTKSPYMLIDFSDTLKINVFVLGSIYAQLVKALYLELPLVDPAVYAYRFACLLDFGDEASKVAQDAIRLVAHMSRDWMQMGRRPAGICGAALFLAARMNNFRRSITEIVEVVKVGDATLRLRLHEFAMMDTGKLTVDAVRAIWLEENCTFDLFGVEHGKRDLCLDDQAAMNIHINGKAIGGGNSQVLNPNEGEKVGTGSFDPSSHSLREGISRRRGAGEDEVLDDAALVATWSRSGDEFLEQAQDLIHPLIVSEIHQTLQLSAFQGQKQDISTAKMNNISATEDSQVQDESDRLDNLDETELDGLICTSDEAEAKGRIWFEFNRDFLQNLADGELFPVKPLKKKGLPRNSVKAPSSSAAESTKAMLSIKAKGFSKKLNYDMIDALFNDSSSVQRTATTPLPPGAISGRLDSMRVVKDALADFRTSGAPGDGGGLAAGPSKLKVYGAAAARGQGTGRSCEIDKS